MKNIHFKSILSASVIVYLLGVTAFVTSYSVPVLSDADFQANLVLSMAILPAAMLGAKFYYRKGYVTNGFLLGTCMFAVAMVLDALITVPLFIIPAGGSHLSFFLDAGFWVIALIYILSVATYWRVRVVEERKGRPYQDARHPEF